jgi:glycosyltransferase involved in cell wall biosynthesis
VTVLSFSDTRFPIERANGLQTMATCHALAIRGHDVTLVVRPDTAPAARDPFVFYDLPPTPNLHVHAIRPRGGRGRSRAGFFLSALGLIRRHDNAVVYTRDLGLASFLLQLPKMRRPRLVYEAHGVADVVAEEMPRLLGNADLAPSGAKLRRLARRDRRVWMTADAYVTITHALADDLALRFGSRSRTFVVPDGAREPVVNRPPSARPGTMPLVVYAGHLYPWKGVDVFLHALQRTPALGGLIVGGHPAEPDHGRIARLIGELGLAGRVEMTGLVAPGLVAAELLRASILVLPNTSSSISERYTSPLKLFEYLWMGKPIVASNLVSIREVLTDGRTAALVTPGDPAALADAMTTLAADPALSQRLGQAARALAPEYTWDMRARRLEVALEAAAR